MATMPINNATIVEKSKVLMRVEINSFIICVLLFAKWLSATNALINLYGCNM
jgi:hypothetical protein